MSSSEHLIAPDLRDAPKTIRKILIANRGEVSLRVTRAAHDLGIKTVAIHSTADADSMHVRMADEAVCVGGPAGADSYLNIPSILSAAQITGADAVHPGYGFLSENSNFAELCQKHGLIWIGPSPQTIDTMGDKVRAKQSAIAAGIPCVPGSPGAVKTVEEGLEIGAQVGYPVLVKAASGGGGRGMKVAQDESELESALAMAASEAKAAFGDDAVYIEKYLTRPRHIEIQVAADEHGNVIHLGERDCSLQRRHQKVLEECPSPALSDEQRKEIGDLTAQAVGNLGYTSVGTVEYLYEDGAFYFIEMNTRIQVEHPVTELVTGVDLVAEQIRIAAGLPLSRRQDEIQFKGHAMEARINAEHPFTFMPSPGQVTSYHAPGGAGVRVDSHLYSGYRIPPYYDSMVAKVITHASDRDACIRRLKRALHELIIGGVTTNTELHNFILDEQAFTSGEYAIHWLEDRLAQLDETDEAN